MSWERTPKDRRLTAQRLVDGFWETCEYEDLKPGDIFRAVDTDGNFVNPMAEDNDDVVAVVVEPPVRALAQDGLLGEGFAVMIDIYDTLDDALKARAN